jgi:hypothetical protein
MLVPVAHSRECPACMNHRYVHCSIRGLLCVPRTIHPPQTDCPPCGSHTNTQTLSHAPRSQHKHVPLTTSSTKLHNPQTKTKTLAGQTHDPSSPSFSNAAARVIRLFIWLVFRQRMLSDRMHPRLTMLAREELLSGMSSAAWPLSRVLRIRKSPGGY